jgi:hypothetical protein
VFQFGLSLSVRFLTKKYYPFGAEWEKGASLVQWQAKKVQWRKWPCYSGAFFIHAMVSWQWCR